MNISMQFIINGMMRKILYLLFANFAVIPLFAQEEQCNYVKSITILSDIDTLEEYSFADGQGRPYQKVKVGFTPSGLDLVDYLEYDLKGRKSKSWLPISTNTHRTPLAYDTFVSESQKQYADPVACQSSLYENSPLNRQIAFCGAGQAWRLNQKVARTKYYTNEKEEVLSFTISESNMFGVLHVGYYAPGMLEKISKYDENGNMSESVYTNVLGQTVCVQSATGKTYCVYDNYGNLRCVIPPALSATLQFGSSYDISTDKNFMRYSYVYKYDAKNRCVQKRLPGCSPQRMIYDNSNRIIFFQDGNLSDRNEWLVNLYDGYGRLVVKGTCVMQTPISIENVTITALFDGQGIFAGYSTNINIPSMNLLKVNYFDNYNYLQLVDDEKQAQLSFVSKAQYDQDITHLKSSMIAQGLVTGCRTYRLDDTSEYKVSAFYYDEKGRIVQSRSCNFLGGNDNVYYSLNYYNGAVKRKYVEHTSSFLQNGGINEEFEYTYDHAGRLLETYHSLNGDNRVLLSSNTYDELGRISVEKVADIPNLLTSFKYNVRGWLTEASNDVCKQSLYYNEKRNEIKSISQWNGNLSSYSCGDKSYDYSYDLSNRLSSSYSTELYNGSLAEGLHSTSYTYDSMGNMLSIQRRSVNLDTCNEGDRDDVTFEYDGNQLVRLTNLGFKDSSYDMQISDEANLDGTEYAYDSNGNMIKDANKGIYLIKYNMLNLPEDIYANNGNWHYSYDADGNKLAVYSITLKTPLVIPSSQLMEKKITDGELEPLSQTMQRSYNGEYVYEYSSQIKKLELVRLGLPNGYISFPASNHVYHFYVKDHLGNNRYVINADTKKVEQTSDYYPFGSLYNENSNENAQRWRFGGKEVNRSFDIYDFLARWYDPTLGRFTTIDPMTEKYVGISPYLYCENNPIRKTDADGKEPGDFFLTTDAAAIDFGLFYNDNSIRENREYASLIIAVANSEGKLGYTYLVPTIGAVNNVVLPNVPAGHVVAASIHSHGAFLTFDGKDYRANEFSGSMIWREDKYYPRSNLRENIPRKTDIYSANSLKRDSYLVTPNGELLKYEYKRGKISVISRQMPQTIKETKPVSVKETFELYNKVIKILLNNQNYSWKK